MSDTSHRLNRIERKLDAVLHLQGLTLREIHEITDEGCDLAALTARLKASSDALRRAVAGNESFTTHEERNMANPTLDALTAQVKASTDVEASATLLINGFADRVQKAVDAAVAGGATAAEIAPVQAEVDAMKASATALSAAVIANTPVMAKKP